GVAEGLAACLGGRPERVEGRRGAAASVGEPVGEEPVGVGPVDVLALGLTVAERGWPLVPIELEPAHRVENGLDVLVGRARPVGAVDAEDEGASVVAGEEPVEERGAGAADVEVARGAGRKTYPDRVGCHSPFYPERVLDESPRAWCRIRSSGGGRPRGG